MKSGKSLVSPTPLMGILVATLLCASTTLAQKATEVFIPIGQSPGLSGKYTTIGTVDSLNLKQKMLVVSDSARAHIIRFTRETRVYIDRSGSGQPNTGGTIRDCRKGMIVEVKYVKNAPEANAEWIKLKK